MTMTEKESAIVEWRESTQRLMSLWRGPVGGTVDTLQRALKADGYVLDGASLAHNVRPKGRKPRYGSDLLQRAAKIIAEKLRHRRSDLDLKEFEEQIARHIETGSPSPLDQRPSPALTPYSGVTSSAGFSAFDLWTPGLTDQEILDRFTADFGPDGAEKAKDLSVAAIDAIGRGDFQGQKTIAEEAIELGRMAPETPMEGEGLYLLAEATRLLADLESDQNKARHLRQEAEQVYGQAVDKLGGDPRALRGLARTVEVLGNLPDALKGFKHAELAIEMNEIAASSSNPHSIIHERVRSLRHKITCLAAIHAEMPKSTPSARRRADEIRTLLLQSEAHHRDALGQFRDHDQWWLIEWFMAQVLHAKGWIAISEYGFAIKRLEWALKQRLEMMQADASPLTSVELGNLHWWANTVAAAAPNLEYDQGRSFHELKAAIDRGENRLKIKTLGKSFITAGAAPWTD